ncbi:hypothetical protein pipiens_011056 [Culex pipiens pipiens]|uniref:Odorant receptor n=1 Tax=Culex pipiens pipiens TaxID=38569 RepID=A0ABD1DB14_CULPP
MDTLKQAFQRYLRFDPTADQFRHLTVLHQVIGFNQVNPLVVKIWRATVALMCCQCFCFAYRVYLAIAQDLGFTYLVCALMVVGGYASGGARMVGFSRFYGDFLALKTHLLKSSSLLRDDPEAVRIRREHYENNQKFTVAMMAAGAGAISIWNLTDYRMTDQYDFPFDLSFLNPLVREVFETLYGFYILSLATYFWIPFITIRVGLRALRAEMLVVNRAYGEVFRKAADGAGFLEGCSDQPSKQAAKLFWTCLQHELTSVVGEHSALLDNVFRIRRLASVPFLAEVFASVSITSIAIFLLMLLGSESLVLVGISCILLVESYYNSSLVEELEEAHQATGHVVYGLEWPTLMKYDSSCAREYKNVRKILLVVIMRSQQSLNFHCGGLFKMSMDTFSVTVKTCYTIFSFLVQVQKD